MRSEAGIPSERPGGEERVQRLSSVLAVLYAIFNEGYSATTGEDWLRPQLCEEAMRLGRSLAQLMPADSEIHGLLVLMEPHASRLNARSEPIGGPVLLLGRREEARAEFERAARLTRNARERALMLGRANAIGPRPPAR